MKTLDAPKTSKNLIAPALMLGATAVATVLIARADKQKLVAGAASMATSLTGTVKDRVNQVVASMKQPVGLRPGPRAVEPEPRHALEAA